MYDEELLNLLCVRDWIERKHARRKSDDFETRSTLCCVFWRFQDKMNIDQVRCILVHIPCSEYIIFCKINRSGTKCICWAVWIKDKTNLFDPFWNGSLFECNTGFRHTSKKVANLNILDFNGWRKNFSICISKAICKWMSCVIPLKSALHLTRANTLWQIHHQPSI